MTTNRIALSAAALLGLALSAPAQRASYTYTMQTSLPANNPPWLVAFNTPRIGTTFQVQVARGKLLLTGVSNPAFDLGPYSRTCNVLRGTLLSSGESILVASPINPNPSVFSWAVPNSPALIGASFYQQAFLMELNTLPIYVCGTSSIRRTFGRGGHGVIGT